jgi:hypothetical protein
LCVSSGKKKEERKKKIEEGKVRPKKEDRR